jgi:hypothetical protein
LSLDLYRFSFKGVFYPQQEAKSAPQQGTIFAPQSGAFFAIVGSVLCDRRERSLRSITAKSRAKMIRSSWFFSKNE